MRRPDDMQQQTVVSLVDQSHALKRYDHHNEQQDFSGDSAE